MLKPRQPKTSHISLTAALSLLILLVALSTSNTWGRQSQNAEVSATSKSLAAPLVESVVSVGIVVSDMDRAIAFYRDVLTFRVVGDVELAGEDYEHLEGLFGLRMRVVTMQLSDERIELTEYLAPKGRPAPPDSRSNDQWFQHIAIITPDIDRAYQWLRQHKVKHASSGPQLLPSWNKNAGGISAFYFKDPDDHVLEILSFPPDKGAAKWRKPADPDQLFLGIDHTAIVVNDTDASLAFYRDAMGMQVQAESENYGTEQEHLNNVFGARLRITSLRVPGSSGPAIELLEYLSPRDGRPYPPDARSCDLFQWQTVLLSTNLAQAEGSLRAAEARFISPGAVDLKDRSLGFRRGLLVRDTDGHVIRVIQD